MRKLLICFISAACFFSGCGKTSPPSMTLESSSFRFEPGALATVYSTDKDSVLMQLDGEKFEKVAIGTPVKIVDDAEQGEEEPGIRQTRIYITEGKFIGRAGKVGRPFLRPAR